MPNFTGYLDCFYMLIVTFLRNSEIMVENYTKMVYYNIYKNIIYEAKINGT